MSWISDKGSRSKDFYQHRLVTISRSQQITKIKKMHNKNVSKTFNYSFKPNSSLWIRIDLSTITFCPSQKIKSSSICNQMELLLKYTRQVLAISFNKGNSKKKSIEEIQIPWNQIASFGIIENHDIEVVFCEGFKAKFCYHGKDNSKGRVFTEEMSKDPSGGLMREATSIVLSPCSKVHPMTIKMFNIGIQRFRFADDNNYNYINNHHLNKVIVDDDDNIYNVNNDISSETENRSEIVDDDLVLFLTHNRAMLTPMNIPLNTLLENIRKRFEIKIKSFEYKNINGDLITVINEDDWKVALWNINKFRNRRIKIYLNI
ncbi:11528_t:CDS:2 [Diversispora eburnea]|uniref:11528_t:CDS:1 n=1 Tax=Diversispora eburnea TaxID=1213867 RepID=A0A9N9AS86_9GLOM|nr:11528_t:CDS:2 [Diversispora eburnea]